MIKLDTFYLERIDIGWNYGLLQGLSMDKKVQDYIDRDFLTWLEKYQAESDEVIEAGKMYIIMHDKMEVGIVGSTGVTEDGFLEVVYAVKKSLRDRGYGKQILAEITPYFLEHIPGIKGIKLRIDESNKGSKAIAFCNGYVSIPDENENGVEYWYYYSGITKERTK